MSHQQSFSYKGTGLPGLNQLWLSSCPRTQHSDACEARTSGHSVSSQALYHWATVLPQIAKSRNIPFSKPAHQDLPAAFRSACKSTLKNGILQVNSGVKHVNYGNLALWSCWSRNTFSTLAPIFSQKQTTWTRPIWEINYSNLLLLCISESSRYHLVTPWNVYQSPSKIWYQKTCKTYQNYIGSDKENFEPYIINIF